MNIQPDPTDEQMEAERTRQLAAMREWQTPALPTVWMAYYSDCSGCAIFGSEIEALRHACDHQMNTVMIVMPCKDIAAEIERQRTAKAGS